MSKYHDHRTEATDPGFISFSPHMFRSLQPDTCGLRGWLWRWLAFGWQRELVLNEHMEFGDSRAACVMSTAPLLVAAYTDELDCIAMLRFPAELASEHGLRDGSRLLTVNTYSRGWRIARDLIAGPTSLNQYANFFPVIAEFVTDDQRRIEERKAEIASIEWHRCRSLGEAYAKRFPGRWRDGSPLRSIRPAK